LQFVVVFYIPGIVKIDLCVQCPAYSTTLQTWWSEKLYLYWYKLV